MLRMKGPGLLGFQLPRPDGLPDVDTLRARMVHLLGHGTPQLAALDGDERDALFVSLALTLARAEYHEQRLRQVVAVLEERRVQAGAAVSFDSFAQYTLFEASGVLGAVRLGVDELIYITARLRGVAASDIHEKWRANDVFTAGFDKRPAFNLPEIVSLRTRKGWADEVNDYRNVLHHRGWRTQIGGYYPRGSDLPEAANHNQNVMLVPDRKSLIGKTRPHEWMYVEKGRLEDVVGSALRGFHELLDEVCMSHWGGALPLPGTVPQEKHANILVTLPRPALLIVGNHVLLPVFTSSADAHAFNGFPSTKDLHLQEVSPTSMVVAEPAFTFALTGLDETPDVAALSGDLILAVDPKNFDPSKMAMIAKASTRIPLHEVRPASKIEPFSVPRGALGVDRLFLWRRR